ncbi:MAG: phosphatase [Clostridia bacterium]|nr:phosphatase [Clostridia bacterium]MDR3643490.1 phosphatase [Clostridia bacterium]
MTVKTDLHCHTIASAHAFSTVLELAQYAAKKGLEAIAVTDHGPAIPDGAHLWHFGNQRCLPPYIHGVRVLHGAETNIIDFEGNVDLPADILKKLDWVIASFHAPVINPGTPEQHTQAYLRLAENPLIDVIGHSGDGKFAYDYEKVLPVFKNNHKLVEINSHSFLARPGSQRNCREIALLCKRFSVPVVVDSDAHVCFEVGMLGAACELLEDIDFPQDLIMNLTLARIAGWLKSHRGRDIL